MIEEDEEALDLGDIEMQDKTAVKKQKSQKMGGIEDLDDLESQKSKRRGAGK